MLNYDIGKTLRFLRKDYGITQKEVSNITHISSSTISKFENNTQSPEIEELMLYLSAIDVSAADYFNKVIELENQNIQLNKAFQKIILHFQEYKNSKLNLIQKELLLFKNLYDNLGSNVFSVYLKTEWYVQLHTLFPNYFNKVDNSTLNKKAEKILRKEHWLAQDFNFLAVVIHNLNPNNILSVLKRIPTVNYSNLTAVERRAFEMILENISDNLILFRNEYIDLKINLKLELNILFKFWENYTTKYRTIENILIKEHNYSIYEICFNIRPLDIIFEESYKRCDYLEKLGLNYISSAMKLELDSYKHNIKSEVNYLITN